ncbi:HK97-gp10 family putative phage morphogenesis protein [Streptomyces hydrogenans]|uniref:HK97-gp10 family putative phage morphogenesis protein n=1 Tax=Streptomyces hydrogenans TaxID=1873719 RepID=UPI0036B0249F
MPRRRGRSRARGQVRLHGLDQLRRSLSALDGIVLEGAAAAVKASAEAVQADTRDRVRQRTGNLHDKLDIHYAQGGLSATVGWKDRADWYASANEFGTRNMRAQPALGPALEEERGKFKARLGDEIRRRLPS